MKKHMSSLMRWLSLCGGFAAAALVALCAMAVTGLLLTDTAQAAQSSVSLMNMLPQALKTLGFTVSTTIAAEIICFPLSWAVSVHISFLSPMKWRERLNRVVNGLSAVPAVVFGYMSLCYIAPTTSSVWWAVVLTLSFMSLMRQTRALVRVNDRYLLTVEAGKAMGAYINEIIFQLVLPQAARGYLAVMLRMMARSASEGVAILLVLSNYYGAADTLSTALMRALGVMGDHMQMSWVLLLATLLLLLVLLSNAMISATVQGGRNESKDKK